MGNIKYIESKIAELKLQLSGCKASKAEKSMFRDEILKLEQMLEEEEKRRMLNVMKCLLIYRKHIKWMKMNLNFKSYGP